MELNKQMFESVVAYVFAEPGAMGLHGTIECLNERGESFLINYLEEEDTWERLKECFEGVRGAKFNGPHKKAIFAPRVLVLGGSEDDPVTTAPDGWRFIAFDCGNHFVCREEYARGFIDLFMGMEPTDIILHGFEKVRGYYRGG